MGDDSNGEILRGGMHRLGIEQNLTLDGSASSFAAIFLDLAGNRAIYMMRGATAELTTRRNSPMAWRVHSAGAHRHNGNLATYPWLGHRDSALRAKHDIPTLLDVDVPPSDACPALGTKAELERALKLATYLKPAKAAAHELAERNEPRSSPSDYAKSYGSKAVFITDGARGCAIAAEGIALKVPAFKVKQVDATGAGDAFFGGVLAGLRWGLPWAKIGRLGMRRGGRVCDTWAHFQRDLKSAMRSNGSTVPNTAGASAAAPAEPSSGNDAPVITGGRRISSLWHSAELATLRDALDLEAVGRASRCIRTAEARGGARASSPASANRSM